MKFYSIIVADGQTIWAIAIQEYGGLDGVYLLQTDNPDIIRDLNEVLEAGAVLKIRANISKTDVENFDIAQHFRENGVRINNA
ncbi:MAG: hypothetical protein RI894_1861 [Bacteroidota bacterium]|jgi:hypothetical protein